MTDRLVGRTAVVTGAGRGIGREIALALAAEGARVVVNDPGVARDGSGSDRAPADEVVAEIKRQGGEAVTNYESVADYAASERIIKTCLDSFGKLDIMVNVAGMLRERMIFNMTEDDWDAVLNVHLKGTFNCTRHAAVLMRQQRSGRIINTTSDAWRGTIGQSNYGAAKGGIVSFTRSIARELGGYGITCNCIAPLAATRMTLDEGVKAGMKKRLEAGLITQERYEGIMRMPGPEYVASAAVYLATDEAANINGQVIGCGGGRFAIYTEPVEWKGLYKDYEKEGTWTVEELIRLVPNTVAVGLVNPAPPRAKEG